MATVSGCLDRRNQLRHTITDSALALDVHDAKVSMGKCRPQVVVRLKTSCSAERPARAAMILVLHDRHSAQVTPIACGGRSTAVYQVEGAVLPPDVCG